MRLIKMVAALVVAMTFVASSAGAQTRPDYDAAARDADRAIQAYKDLQDRKLADLAQESMASAKVDLYICKPMHDQTALTRRQYIASVVRKRSKQNAVAAECAAQELAYANICKPKPLLIGQNEIITSEPACPIKWADWPPMPRALTPEFDQRVAEIWRLYQ